MSGEDKSRWQQEFDSLPPWAQKMVRALSGYRGHGYGRPPPEFAAGMNSKARKSAEMFHALFNDSESAGEFFSGFGGMRELARGMTAPYPPPAAPAREKRAVNIVEMVAGDDCAFDQKCAFGHRVEGHAVYCHNEAWPDAPTKCKRGEWLVRFYGGEPTDYRHEDCPGFVANPDFKPSAQ